MSSIAAPSPAAPNSASTTVVVGSPLRAPATPAPSITTYDAASGA
jgi:hypothetical protein